MSSRVFFFVFFIILYTFFPLYSESPVVRFGSDMDYPPLSFRSEGEIATGFDMDLLSELERVTDMRTKSITAPWAEVLTMLEEGRLDAVTGIIRTEGRREEFDFTVPYFFGSYVIFAAEGSTIDAPGDLAGKTGAMLSSDAAIESFLTPHDLHHDVTYTSSFTKALRLVDEGEIDYTVAPLSLGKSILREEGLENVTDVGRPLFPIRYRMAVRKGNSELLFALNEAIYELRRNGTIHSLYQKWRVQHPFDRAVDGLPFPLFMLVGGGLVLLLGLIALFFYLLKFYADKKTRALDGERKFLMDLLRSLPFRLSWEDAFGRFNGGNSSSSQSTAGPLEGAPEEIKKSVLRTATAYAGSAGEGRGKLSVLPIFTNNGDVRGTLSCREEPGEEELLKEKLRRVAKEFSSLRCKLEEREVSDPLTGLYNIKYMKKRITEEIALHKRYGSSFSLILFHYAISGDEKRGSRIFTEDEEVRTAAEKIRTQLRNVDIVGRLEGRVFLVLLPRTELSEAEVAAGKIAKTLGKEKLRFTTLMYRGEEVDTFFMYLRNLLPGEQSDETA